jgi:hypothetical protein
MAEKKALQRKNREEILRKASAYFAMAELERGTKP